MFDPQEIAAAEGILASCRAQGLRLVTAESCTGGLVAALLTEIAGSSDVFDRGLVTYSNEAKTELLGVPASLLANHGAVSMEVAVAMAEGALRASNAGLSVSVTGIAGPGGGSAAKPVGLVHLASARIGQKTAHQRLLVQGATRAGVRQASLRAALKLLALQTAPAF